MPNFHLYTEYNDQLKAKGIQLTKYPCPCCGMDIEGQPAAKCEVWDTLSSCPHCDDIYLKVSDGEKVYGAISDFRF